MKSSSMNHPLPTSGPSLYLRTDKYNPGSAQNRELEKEARDLADKYISMDNQRGDLEKAPGYVRLQSRSGRVTTALGFRNHREETGCFRDREGYWDCQSKTVLDNAVYTRTELDKEGTPTKTVTVSYTNGLRGSLCSKTIQDKYGKSIAIGGAGRNYEVSYFPGDAIDSRA